MSDYSGVLLRKLLDMKGFKMTSSHESTGMCVYVEAEGITYHWAFGTRAPIEELLEETYLYFAARIQARELIKQAKIVVEGQ